MPTWPLQSDCDDFYGDPRAENERHADPEWVRENLVKIAPPWKLVDEDSGEPVVGITIHRKCAPSLSRVLQAIWQQCGENQEWITRNGLDQFSGSFVFRNMRGGSHLSMHSYGCALDFASEQNPQGRPWSPRHGLPMAAVKCFENEGWVWGGRWRHVPDPMHFQAARVG